ncbi:MAG: DUF4271 domain-containing protein [Tidjanibacter sp.]|nr:DUF4271 domain-containing protein [Tidjanibacter sp.]
MMQQMIMPEGVGAGVVMQQMGEKTRSAGAVSDTLSNISDEIALAVERMFGSEAVMNTEAVMKAPELLDILPFKLFSMLTLVLYLFVVFVFADDIKLFFRQLFSSNNLNDKIEGRLSINGFVLLMNLLGLVAMALFVSICVWNEGLQQSATMGKTLMLIVSGFIGWGLYKRLLLHGAGALTFNKNSCSLLNENQERFFALFSLVTIPLVLLLSFDLVSTEGVVYGAFIVLVVLYFVTYFFRILFLFIKEKISILLWILYLCTVDLVPLVTIIVLALGIR